MPTQECVFVASVLSIWRNSCGVLSFQNIWTVCLLFLGFDSIALYKSEFSFFFFYWDAGLIFLFNHCVLNCNSQIEKSTTHRTSTYVSLTQGKREHCQHSTVSSWDLQNFHKTSGFSWRAYLRVSLAFPRSYGMTFFSTLFTFHCCSAHF